MNTFPFILLLNPAGQPLTSEQAIMALSRALKGDPALIGLKREIATLSPNDAVDFARVVSDSPAPATVEWCRRLVSVIRPHLGSGCIYIAFVFTPTSTRIVVVGHCLASAGVLSNVQRIEMIASQCVATSVTALCKADGKTRSQLHQFLLWQLSVARGRAVPAKKPGSPSSPGSSGRDI